MADALVVLDHWHAGMFGHEADQAFAAAWNGQVNQVGELQQLQDMFARGIGNQRDRRRGQSRIAQRRMQAGGNCGIAVRGFRPTAQQHRIASFQA